MAADPQQPLFLHSDFTKAPTEIVIDLINYDNGTALRYDELEFGLPEAITGGHNTTVEVTAVEGVSSYSGSVQITYNRVDLATVPGVRSRGMLVPPEGATTISDIVDQINTRYAINLTPDDYFDDPLPDVWSHPADEQVPFTLRAKPESLIWIGQVDLTVYHEPVRLSDVIKKVVLSGLVYVQPEIL
jgi:hypothetical protein